MRFGAFVLLRIATADEDEVLLQSHVTTKSETDPQQAALLLCQDEEVRSITSCNSLCNDPQAQKFLGLVDTANLKGKNGRLQGGKIKTFIAGLYEQLGEKDRLCYSVNKCKAHLDDNGITVEEEQFEFLNDFCAPITQTRRLATATMQSFCYDACDPVRGPGEGPREGGPGGRDEDDDLCEPKEGAKLVMGDKDATGFCEKYCRSSSWNSHCEVKPNDIVTNVCEKEETDGTWTAYPDIRVANIYWCQLHCEHKGELDGTFHVGNKKKEAMCIPGEDQPDVPAVDTEFMKDAGFTLEFGCREHCFHKEHDDPSFKGSKCHGNPKSENLCNMINF